MEPCTASDLHGVPHRPMLTRLKSCRRNQIRDTVIRGGTIFDGAGAAAFAGDIAIDSGLITHVGCKAGPGKREIDADGLLITPSWVDVHTHSTCRRLGIRSWPRRGTV
jgi:imidazolonepropionase-like amidohydrolase